MKKLLLTLNLFLLSSFAMGCQVVLINDENVTVSVKDLNAPEKSFRHIKPSEKINANFDPDTHARLLIKIGPRFYSVQQHACSKSHEIPLNTSALASGDGGELLTIIKSNNFTQKDTK